MSYQVPHKFMTGEKAIASEFNENFDYLSNALNETSLDLNNKIIDVKSGLSLKSLIPFCFNSGLVNEMGESAFVQISEVTENEVTSKTLTLITPATYTDGFGTTYTINEDITLDYSELPEGEYSIRVKEAEGVFSIDLIPAKVYRSKTPPSDPKAGDLWQNLSTAPYLVYKYDENMDKTLSKEVEAGVLKIAGGGAELKLNPYNLSFDDLNSIKLIKTFQGENCSYRIYEEINPETKEVQYLCKQSGYIASSQVNQINLSVPLLIEYKDDDYTLIPINCSNLSYKEAYYVFYVGYNSKTSSSFNISIASKGIEYGVQYYTEGYINKEALYAK